MLFEQYADKVIDAINAIRCDEREKLLKAARMAADVLVRDGLIYVFGCGHSHILAEETFYRAGGLLNVAPMLYPPLMLHEGAAESSHLEKQPGLAEKVLAQYPIGEADMLFCLSTSGVNAVPVELAMQVHDRGIPVVAICSSAYFDMPSRAPCGKHLYQVCDLWLDNRAPFGDACLQPKGAPIPTTPLSTITASYILNSVLAEGMELALQAGAKVPSYLSGNIPGGPERNQAWIEAYQPRIKHL